MPCPFLRYKRVRVGHISTQTARLSQNFWHNFPAAGTSELPQTRVSVYHFLGPIVPSTPNDRSKITLDFENSLRGRAVTFATRPSFNTKCLFRRRRVMSQFRNKSVCSPSFSAQIFHLIGVGTTRRRVLWVVSRQLRQRQRRHDERHLPQRQRCDLRRERCQIRLSGVRMLHRPLPVGRFLHRNAHRPHKSDMRVVRPAQRRADPHLTMISGLLRLSNLMVLP